MYISYASTPVNEKDYSTKEDAIADFLRPIGTMPAGEISKWFDENRFMYFGRIYRVENDTNPVIIKAAIAQSKTDKLAERGLPADFVAATEKQVNYLKTLLSSSKKNAISASRRTRISKKIKENKLSKEEASTVIEILTKGK